MTKQDKLTPHQRIILDRMNKGQWYSPRELKTTLATMRALRREGLVKTDKPDKHMVNFSGKFSK